MSASLVNGLLLGTVYGLFAVGIVLVYRVDRVVNFAHGNIGMIGTLLFVTWWTKSGLPLVLAVVLGCLASGALAGATSYFVARPLRNQRPEIATLATFGVGLLLLTYGRETFGVDPLLNPPLISGISFKFGGVFIQKVQVLTVIVAVLLFFLLLVLNRTRWGTRVRAVALNPQAAAGVGIRTEWVSVAVWSLSGVVAGLSGILISSRGALKYDFMTSFMLRGLVVALVGGLTSLGGGFVAGLVVGLAEGYIGYRFSGPGYQEAFLALIIIAVLIVRPSGIFRAQY